MANIVGTAVADLLNGTAGNDVITALAGNDRVNGGGGDDVLFGFGPGGGGGGEIRATLVSSAFARSVFAMSAPGDPDRLYVTEQLTGKVRILDTQTGAVNATPFLDIPDAELSRGGEEGLLGFAFHPDYAANGRFFVYLVNAAGDIELRQYTRSAANPDRADAASGDLILTIAHPTNSNHNGGWIAFGPDGQLYVSVGDGGSGGDPLNNAQNKNVLLGKMLRLDVNGDDFASDPNRDYAIPDGNPFVGVAGADEIWATGLRNPWRPSFDRLTGDLYIADVGQGSREEVNFQDASSDGGENYGWKVKEGKIVFDDGVPGNPPATTPPLTDPLVDYPHEAGPGGGFSITGGYVYRGSAPGLQGHYFFADFVTDQLWTFKEVNGVATEFTNRTADIVASGGTVDSIASFAEDGRGNLYVLGLDGEIFRLDPQEKDGADSISGGAGVDVIHGGGGNDRIDGGEGSDRLLSGGTGDDVITGAAGDDRLDGGDGNDALRGEAGADSMAGGEGVDFLAGGLGNDRIDGGAGSDRFLGGEAGNDAITGGLGDDRIDGGTENDSALGGAGNDAVLGGAGLDKLWGDAGNDFLDGGAGTDRMYGGTGFDRFNFEAACGADVILDFINNQDTLVIDPGFGFASASQALSAAVQSGNDVRFNLGGGNSITLWNYLAPGGGNTISNLIDDIAIA